MHTLLKRAHGVIITYDITNRNSIKSIRKWSDKVKENCDDNVFTILVGCKCDKKEKRQVSYEEGEEIAEKHGLLFVETSAKDDLNVTETFAFLTEKIKERQKPEIVTEKKPLKYIIGVKNK